MLLATRNIKICADVSCFQKTHIDLLRKKLWQLNVERMSVSSSQRSCREGLAGTEARGPKGVDRGLGGLSDWPEA